MNQILASRPNNGGKPYSLLGEWKYEPKWNGRRVMLHCPSGVVYGKMGQELSTSAKLGTAIKLARKLQALCGRVKEKGSPSV